MIEVGRYESGATEGCESQWWTEGPVYVCASDLKDKKKKKKARKAIIFKTVERFRGSGILVPNAWIRHQNQSISTATEEVYDDIITPTGSPYFS